MADRSIPAAALAALEQQESPEAILAFLTITHEALDSPIRVVSDVFDYVTGGNTYIGLPFGYRILTDDESAPQTELRVQNTDRRIGQALRRINSPARIDLVIRSSADFNLANDPRTEITSAPIYAVGHYRLLDVRVGVDEITGRVMLRDYSQEAMPGLRATQSRCPGLFR